MFNLIPLDVLNLLRVLQRNSIRLQCCNFAEASSMPCYFHDINDLLPVCVSEEDIWCWSGLTHHSAHMKWSLKFQINCAHRMLKFKSTFWQHVITLRFYIAAIKESWTLHIQNIGNNLLQNYNSITWTPKNDQEIFTKYCNKASTNVINNLYVPWICTRQNTITLSSSINMTLLQPAELYVETTGK